MIASPLNNCLKCVVLYTMMYYFMHVICTRKTNSVPKETWLSSFTWTEILLAEKFIQSKACYIEDTVTKIENLTKDIPIIRCV